LSTKCTLFFYFRCHHICWWSWWESEWSYFMGIISSSRTCQ